MRGAYRFEERLESCEHLPVALRGAVGLKREYRRGRCPFKIAVLVGIHVAKLHGVEDQPIDLGKDVVEEGFARGYVPHARAGKLREHVVRVLGKGVRFSGHEATECVRAGDVEGDVHAVRFEDSLDFGVRACACDAYVGHRGGEVRLRLQGVVDPRGGDGLVRIALRSFAAFAPCSRVRRLVAVGETLRDGARLRETE